MDETSEKGAGKKEDGEGDDTSPITAPIDLRNFITAHLKLPRGGQIQYKV